MSNEKNLAMRFALEAALKQTKKPRGFKEGHKAGLRARGMTACMIYADDAPYQKFIGVDPGVGEDGKPMVDELVIGHKLSTDFGDRGVIVARKDLLTTTPVEDTEYFNRRNALLVIDEEGNLKPQEILSADGTKGVRVAVLKAPPELSEQISGTVEALVSEEAISKRVVGAPSVDDSEECLDETYALPGDSTDDFRSLGSHPWIPELKDNKSPAYALDQISKAELGDSKIKFESRPGQAVLIDPFQSAADADLNLSDLDGVTAESRSASHAIMFIKPRKVTPGVFTVQDKHSYYQQKNDEFRAELETLDHPLNHDRVKLKIMDAQELLLESKGGLVGQKIYTMSTEDFAGGLVTITEIAPDDNCQEIIFEVTNEAGQTMGVFFDEVIGVPV